VVLEPSGWSNGVQQPYPAHQQHQHQHQQQHQRGDSLEELLGLLPRHLLISPTQCNAGDPQLADALARRAADNGCATTKGLLALHQAKLMRSNRGFSDAALEDGAPRTDKRLVGGNTRSVIEYLSARGAAALAAAAAAAAATEASLKQSDTAESAGLDQSWQATTSGAPLCGAQGPEKRRGSVINAAGGRRRHPACQKSSLCASCNSIPYSAAAQHLPCAICHA
jgi:murein DD-endopeptidase MepM/ murein hydrolase activator NlpD